MKNIVEFLVKKHLTQQKDKIKIAYLNSRNAYYLYLEYENGHESDDIKLFKTNVITKISDKYREQINDEFEECLLYYKNHNSIAIGIRFLNPFDDDTISYMSYTNFKNGLLLDELKFFSISVNDLLECIETDWENIENYIND